LFRAGAEFRKHDVHLIAFQAVYPVPAAYRHKAQVFFLAAQYFFGDAAGKIDVIALPDPLAST
jgi:hypothetical protein